ncbi:MAG TPA: ABC transporter ATP-binding protein [Polyangiaceae bacterium]|nr:ABC transporter ATP-binding protein [Polyangiaceae bacterium]
MPDRLGAAPLSSAEPRDDVAVAPGIELPLLVPGAALPSTPLGFIGLVLRGRYRWGLGVMVLGEAVHASCGILLPFALSRIITGVTSHQGDPRAVLRQVSGALVAFAGLCAGEALFGRLNSAVQLRIAPRQRQYIARALFDYLHRHSHRFFSENFAGALAHRISEVSHGTNQVLWAAITEFWPIAIAIGVANALLASTHVWLGTFTLLWSVAFVSISVLLARRTQPLAHAASNARARTIGQVVDSVSNHAAVRLFARHDHERRLIDRSYAAELETVLISNLAMERVRWFQFGASAVLKAGTVALAVWLYAQGAIDVGAFVMAVSLALLVISEVRNLSRRFLELFESLGNVGSGVRAILRPLELVDASGAGDRTVGNADIEFDAVRFTYADSAPVFRDFSVRISSGQRVGLVGLSGSGKSTFVSLLLRLYDPQGGCIRIGGAALPDYSQRSLRRQIGLIPQDPTLFHRTLRENIRYGDPDASDAAVEEAARSAHAHGFISELPEGYDAEVGERGVKLSGGQRQRIAIARVILKNAPILVLDEATSSLDSITEHQIQKALDAAMADKTVIVIAHRLSTIAHLDRVLVFARGEIVEDGTHHELLARRGEYYRLWRRQSGGVLPESTGKADDAAPRDPDPALADAAGARIADGASPVTLEPA